MLRNDWPVLSVICPARCGCGVRLFTPGMISAFHFGPDYDSIAGIERETAAAWKGY
jgi:hypothetical protein